MSTQWDNKETFGEWISKEVYFQDGWPCVIRDPIKKWVGLTDDDYETLSQYAFVEVIEKVEALLKEKNT
jgi:hypothetical protein